MCAMRGLVPDLQADEHIEPVVLRLHAAATRAHPDVELDAHTWGQALGRALEDEPTSSHAARLAALPAADLWLASAAASGDPGAIETFERTLIPEVDRALRRFSLAEDEFDELRQRIRVRLLVAGPTAAARIGQYRGRGSLAGWVRTVTTRNALNALRGRAKPTRDPDELSQRLLASTPELAQFRREYHDVFARAFRGAFLELSARARNLLRLRHVDEVPLEALARAYQVHISTASRWLTSARDALAEGFATRAHRELGDPRAVEELVGLVQSRFQGNLCSLLASGVEGDPPAE